ncbi:MAG: hypothetical protein JO362_07485 [Streptomycetaceae bacterium]|nr:hypothetical protein [Streptomycetaceae bacterium]
MFEPIRRWRPRHAVKAGITIAVAAAAGGAIFASQAGAANVQTKNVMVKTPPGIPCIAVTDYASDGSGARTTERYNFRQLGWKPGWNSTGIQAQVGDTIAVWVSRTCPAGSGGRPADGFQVKASGLKNAWFDDTWAFTP